MNIKRLLISILFLAIGSFLLFSIISIPESIFNDLIAASLFLYIAKPMSYLFVILFTVTGYLYYKNIIYVLSISLLFILLSTLLFIISTLYTSYSSITISLLILLLYYICIYPFNFIAILIFFNSNYYYKLKYSKIIDLLTEINDFLKIHHIDFNWSGYRNIESLLAEINTYIISLNNLDHSSIKNINVLFAPTGPLQELSISNGWTDYYIDLSNRYDNI